MKRYCFIDLHMHSIFSNEDGCVQTPKQILDQVVNIIKDEREKEERYLINTIFRPGVDFYKEICEHYQLETEEEKQTLKSLLNSNDLIDMADKIATRFVRACISITDHNSILGSIEAIKEIEKNPEKYACIDFIPGAEFNTSLKELGLNENRQSIYSKSHILVYSYDINDKDLKLFSELFQLTIGKANFNVGQDICAVREYFYQRFNILVPYSEFETILEYGKQYEFYKHGIQPIYNKIREDTFNVFKKYAKENINMQEFISSASQYFPRNAKIVQENAGHGKLRISELDKMANNANGKMVLAHPAILTRNKKRAHTHEDFEALLEDFISRVKTLTNHDLYGIEAFHPDCSEYLEPLIKVAKKHDMYITGGSDNHGVHLHPHNKISRCFNKTYEYNSILEPPLWPEQIKNRIIWLATVDDLLDKKIKYPNKQSVVVQKVSGEKYAHKSIIKISNIAYQYSRIEYLKKHHNDSSHNNDNNNNKNKNHQKLTPKQEKKQKKEQQNERKKVLEEQGFNYADPKAQKFFPFAYKKQWRDEYVKEHEDDQVRVEEHAGNQNQNCEQTKREDERQL